MAQSQDALQQGAAVKERMLAAFGGKQAIKRLKQFQYTLVQTAYLPETTDTAETKYTLDLQKRYITVSAQTPTGTVIKTIRGDGGWLIKEGKQAPLTEQEKAALMRTFFFNFVPMLQNEQLQFAYLRSSTYQNRSVDLVRVTDPANAQLTIDLFVDQENGQVLTSSSPVGSAADAAYPYYADELDYVPVGKGIIFPLVYRIYKQGKLSTEGVFTQVRVR